MINPDLFQEVTQLADLLRAKFSPTEFIPGCLVKSVADKSQYATNNGWIEAVCGQHNQQRVRWKSNETVAVNDFVDVLYFPDRRLFEAYGLGGAGAIAARSWPFAHVLTVSQTDTDAQYSTIGAAITAASANDIILIDAGTYTEILTINKALALVGVDAKMTIITSSTADSSTITITAAACELRNLTVNNLGTGAQSNCIKSNQNNITLDNCTISKTSGAATINAGVYHYGGTGWRIINCDINASGGASFSFAYMNDTALATGEMIACKLNGSSAALSFELYSNQSTSAMYLNWCILVYAKKSYDGTLQGTALDGFGRRLRVKPIGINDGRMTLTTALPVTTSNVTAATTIYYTPYLGGNCEVYNGSFWIEAPFTELSLALTSFTANKNSDLWVYDNAGTLTLERTEWTNDTTRATALAYQDGRYCKSGTLTRLYLGTFRTTGTTGQCEDSVTKRYVWNNYNRVPRSMFRSNGTSHTYNTATYRAFNNDAANSQVEFVLGLNEQSFVPIILATMGRGASTDGTPNIALGLNTTTAASSGVASHTLIATLSLMTTRIQAPAAGYHFICANEITSPTGATAPTYNVIEVEFSILG